MGPNRPKNFAKATGTNSKALYRIMRTLGSLGLYTEDTEQRFSLKPLGEALKSGTAGHATALILAGELVNRPLDQLLYSVQTGSPAFEKAFGASLFEWFGKHPIEASLFSKTMVGLHGGEPPAIAAAYDFFQDHRGCRRGYWEPTLHYSRPVFDSPRNSVRSATCRERCACASPSTRGGRSN